MLSVFSLLSFVSKGDGGSAQVVSLMLATVHELSFADSTYRESRLWASIGTSCLFQSSGDIRYQCSGRTTNI